MPTRLVLPVVVVVAEPMQADIERGPAAAAVELAEPAAVEPVQQRQKPSHSRSPEDWPHPSRSISEAAVAVLAGVVRPPSFALLAAVGLEPEWPHPPSPEIDSALEFEQPQILPIVSFAGLLEVGHDLLDSSAGLDSVDSFGLGSSGIDSSAAPHLDPGSVAVAASSTHRMDDWDPNSLVEPADSDSVGPVPCFAAEAGPAYYSALACSDSSAPQYSAPDSANDRN